jgi:glyoxylase I family protein
MTESTGRHRPAIAAVHHFAATVTDVEASASWYQRVLGLQHVDATFPHYGAEDSGYSVLLIEPSGSFAVALHHHDANVKEPADETRTGLDHLSLAVPSRSTLDEWAQWLEDLGVTHSPVTDVEAPVPFSVLVFRDPDNIQLEFIYMPTG